MSEEIIVCPKCNFKCVKSQLYKSKGECPVCINKKGEHVVISKSVQAEVAGVA